MKKYRGDQTKPITKAFVTEEEFAAIDTIFPVADRNFGDECWIEDVVTKKMISAHVWTGRCWGHYLNFSV